MSLRSESTLDKLDLESLESELEIPGNLLKLASQLGRQLKTMDQHQKQVLLRDIAALEKEVTLRIQPEEMD